MAVGCSILYVCNEDRATTLQRLMALRELDCDTDIIYTSRLDEKVSLLIRVKRSVFFRAGIFPERNQENRRIIEAMQKKNYDILFIEKGLSIKRSTLLNAKQMQPRVKIVSYSLDDMMNPGNSSRQYRKALTVYDYHFTNKKYNVPELEQLGAKNVFYFRNAYSKHVHRPVAVNAAELALYQADVSFIGTYESERVEMLRYLADNGVIIKVWGWGRSAVRSGMVHQNIIMTNRYVYDDAYAKVVCASRINLCFLRKVNRDTETTRSIEIPACGGFMIAEDTPEHRSLFEAGKEAVYFSSKEELLDKIKYYLSNDSERARIAENALARCRRDDYSYHHQLSTIIKQVLG